MRLCYLICISLFSLNVYTQCFNPAEEWFTLSPFFFEKKIKSNKINSISIVVQSKQDGKKINTKPQYLNFFFDKEGRLIISQKITSLNKKNDTSEYHFLYNDDDLLAKKIEYQGPFVFSYIYLYKQGRLVKEIKVNEKSKDTLYNRVVRVAEYESSMVVETLNDNGNPYKVKKLNYDSKARLVHCKINFTRNRNYIETFYKYSDRLVSEIEHIAYFNKKEIKKIRFQYKNNVLDEVDFFRNYLREKKYAILYNEKGLERAVIERDYKNSRIRIFNIYFN